MLIRPLHGKSELNPVIVTIGLLVVFEGLAGAIYGNASRGFPAAFYQRGLRVGSTTVAFSHFDVFILVAVARADGRNPRAVPLHRARAPHARLGLPP